MVDDNDHENQVDRADWHLLYETLKWQSDSYRNYYRSTLDRLNNIMILSFSIALAATTITFHYRLYPLGFGLPFVFAVVGFIGLSISNELFALAAYCDVTDRRLASLLDERHETRGHYVPWADAAGSITRFNISVLALNTLFSLELLFVGILSLGIAWSRSGNLWWVGVICGVAFLIVVSIEAVAYVQTLDVYEYVQSLMTSKYALAASANNELADVPLEFPNTYWWTIKPHHFIQRRASQHVTNVE